jgi:hypothetical protein
LLCCLALFATPARAQECQTKNLMPEYLAFDARTTGMAPQRRADLFMKEIVAAHPDYYTRDEFSNLAKVRKSAARLLDPSKPIMLGGFGPLTDERVRAVAANVMPTFDKAEGNFAQAFPDFHCRADVVFGVSLLHFDGHGYSDKSGRQHMRFGIDMIALIHPPRDLPAFFAHELFHIYHAEALPGVHPEDNERTWWAMWEEGLATYVSRQMNMPLTEQQVLWFPGDMVARMEKAGMMRAAAKGMLADFDTTRHYGLWFQAGSSAPGLPSRVGYFMGLRMAEELGRTRSLEQLAHLSPAQVKPLARAFLEERGRQAAIAHRRSPIDDHLL